MSYTIYFSVTRFNSETFAYVSSRGEEGRFIRKQLVDLMKISANQSRWHIVVTMVTFTAPLYLFLSKYNLSLTSGNIILLSNDLIITFNLSDN